jgi:hypothetical protein
MFVVRATYCGVGMEKNKAIEIELKQNMGAKKLLAANRAADPLCERKEGSGGRERSG